MKRVLLLVAAGIMGIFGVIGGFAASAEPGPNGKNDHGLCTAYFNGQKNGHGEGEDQTNQPPAFQGLEDTAREHTNGDGQDNDKDGQTDEPNEDDSLTDAENIYNYCQGLIGGNSAHGRFTCSDPGTDGPSTDPFTDPECETNEGPGKS